MRLERMVVGLAAALWAAFVPGTADVCLDHQWETPSRWLRRRMRAVEPRLGAGAATAEAGRLS